jgi:hypothetical protein
MEEEQEWVGIWVCMQSLESEVAMESGVCVTDPH